MAYKRISPMPVIEGGTGAITLTGVCIGNGTSAITGNAVTQYNVLIGGASNAISSVAPGTTGIPLISQGAAANPAFGTAVVGGGGTGATTLTGILIGNGTSAFTASTVTQYGTVVAGTSNTVSSIAPSATSGVPYISQGNASNPTFGTAVVAGGGTGLTSATAYAVLCGGTTSTAAFQSIASVGSSGNVLTSNGAGALPTFQAAGGGGGNSVLVGGGGQAAMSSTGGIYYNGLGSTNTSVTAANVYSYMPVAGTLSKLYVYVWSNGNTNSSTATIYKNNVATAITTTLTASTTGAFTDLTHSVSVSAGDQIYLAVSQAATGLNYGAFYLNFNG